MDDIFKQLEMRIKGLTQKYLRLSKDHAQLKLAKAELLSKHKMAISQIEKMVLQLKTLEKTK